MQQRQGWFTLAFVVHQIDILSCVPINQVLKPSLQSTRNIEKCLLCITTVMIKRHSSKYRHVKYPHTII
jgi:hypothetical protein